MVNNRPKRVQTNLKFKRLQESGLGWSMCSFMLDWSGHVWAIGEKIYAEFGATDIEVTNSPIMVTDTHNFQKVITFVGSGFGVKGDGTVWWWGDNNNFVSGTGSADISYIEYTPIQTAIGHSFQQLSGSGTSVCGLDTNGAAWTWGHNDLGQLGILSRISQSLPVSMAGGHSFKHIIMTEYSFCGLKEDGSVWGCGDNSGQTGDLTTTRKSSPVAAVGNHSFIKIATCDFSVNGLKANGEVWSWGGNNSGELGRGNATATSSPVSVIGDHSFVDIQTFNATVLATKSNGEIWGWGQNTSYELANGTNINVSSPILTTFGGFSFTQVSGDWTTNFIGLNSDGSLHCWADGPQHSNLSFVAASSPIAVISNNIPIRYRKHNVASNGLRKLANTQGVGARAGGITIGGEIVSVMVSGSPTAAGANPYFKNYSTYWIPMDYPSYDWDQYSLSLYLSAGLKLDGRVFCWGSGTNGALGNLSVTSQYSPVEVAGNHSFTQVVCSTYSMYALKANGSAWSWGANTYGQLGDRSTSHKSSPVSVHGSHSFIKVVCNNDSALGLKADGSTWGWGRNLTGTIGDNSKSAKSSPVSTIGGMSFVDIAFGVSASYFLDGAGQVWASGLGTNGALGDNSATSKSSPVKVVGDHSFIKILAGNAFAVALKSNGELWSWGLGSSLGDNIDYPGVDQSSPIKVAGNHSFVDMSVGSAFVTALKDGDDSLWAWGNSVAYRPGFDSVHSPIKIVNGYWSDSRS